MRRIMSTLFFIVVLGFMVSCQSEAALTVDAAWEAVGTSLATYVATVENRPEGWQGERYTIFSEVEKLGLTMLEKLPLTQTGQPRPPTLLESDEIEHTLLDFKNMLQETKEFLIDDDQDISPEFQRFWNEVNVAQAELDSAINEYNWALDECDQGGLLKGCIFTTQVAYFMPQLTFEVITP